MDESSKRGSLRRLGQDAPSESERDRLVRHLASFVERSKTRRRRGDPPAALPAPVEPRPSGGGFSGGAAAALTFEEA